MLDIDLLVDHVDEEWHLTFYNVFIIGSLKALLVACKHVVKILALLEIMACDIYFLFYNVLIIIIITTLSSFNTFVLYLS